MKKFIVALVMALMLVPMTVFAATNQVSVGVKDENGDIILFANATLANEEGEYKELVNAGMAEFRDIPEGVYTLTVTADTFNTYTDSVTITSEVDQDINIVLTKAEVVNPPEEYGSVLNVTVNYYDKAGTAHMGNKPDATEKHSYDLHLNSANTVEVPLEVGSYIMDAAVSGVTFQQKHFNNNGVVISVTATEKEYNVIFYVQRNYTSRLYVYGALYEDNTWTKFNGYTHYIEVEGNTYPKAETVQMLYGTSISVDPEKVSGYDLIPVYVLTYTNGGTETRTTLEEWGLAMDPTTGVITGNGPALSGNEFLSLTFYYARSEGQVITDYVDEAGNSIIDSVTTTGKVGDTYETEQKEIEGYTFDKVTDNATGKYTDETINVIYSYKQIMGNLVVKYVDDYGKALTDDVLTTGGYGTEYTTEEKEFYGYKLIEVQGDATGKYNDGTITVTYVYQYVLGTGGDDPIPGDDTPKLPNSSIVPYTGIEDEGNDTLVMFMITISLLGGALVFRKRIFN